MTDFQVKPSPIEHVWSSLWASRFSAVDVRLRFELGGEELDNLTQQIPRFLQAHRRASALADALFHERCVGIAAWNGSEVEDPSILETGNAFDALQATGFLPSSTNEWEAVLFPAPSGHEPLLYTLRSYEMSRDKLARDTLLWHAVAAEMPICPSIPIKTFLIDPESALMLHAYDDRGMDVIADAPAKLREPYSTFSDWLLDYDRPRMDELFL